MSTSVSTEEYILCFIMELYLCNKHYNGKEYNIRLLKLAGLKSGMASTNITKQIKRLGEGNEKGKARTEKGTAKKIKKIFIKLSPWNRLSPNFRPFRNFWPGSIPAGHKF